MEKKRLKRKHCKVYMKVLSSETDTLIGYLVNITTEGLMLVGEEPIETDESLQLKLILPTKIKGVNQVNLSAQAIWCEQDSNPEFYNIGFLLREVPRKNIRIIERLIKKYSFKD